MLRFSRISSLYSKTSRARRHGGPRKHIYGTATINGGRHRVIIRSVNGNIRIKTG